MSGEKSKRPWFRFHLLTAVLMMLASSGVLFLNWRCTPHPILGYSTAYYERGWPLRMNIGNDGWQTHVEWTEPTNSLVYLRNDTSPPTGLQGTWYVSKALLNLLALLIILVTVSLISESMIRRREARKT